VLLREYVYEALEFFTTTCIADGDRKAFLVMPAQQEEKARGMAGFGSRSVGSASLAMGILLP
jgi:hypothetical protein